MFVCSVLQFDPCFDVSLAVESTEAPAPKAPAATKASPPVFFGASKGAVTKGPVLSANQKKKEAARRACGGA